MKHFINVFVVLVLVGLAVLNAYMTTISSNNAWGIGFLPITVFMGLWGYKLFKDY